MSKARLIITAVAIEGRSQAQVARDYDVSAGWVSKLVARYRTEGDAALEPRSRRPHTTPSRTDDAIVGLICALRRNLTTRGLDAGADTIAWHLTHHHDTDISRPKASPDEHTTTEHRVRTDRVSHGNVSLRIDGHLHHIALGRQHDRTPIIMLIDGHHIRIIHAATGEILRDHTIDTTRRYHGTGKPRGGPTGPRKPKQPEP